MKPKFMWEVKREPQTGRPCVLLHCEEVERFEMTEGGFKVRRMGRAWVGAWPLPYSPVVSDVANCIEWLTVSARYAGFEL